MSRIKWDETGARTYETGVKNGVLYVFDANQEEYGTLLPAQKLPLCMPMTLST